MRASYLVAIGLVAALGPLRADEPAPQAKEKILKAFVEEFVLLTPGKDPYPPSFIMGCDDGPAAERPAHKVTFDYFFAIGKYEVTQELYEAVMGQNPSKWRGPR